MAYPGGYLYLQSKNEHFTSVSTEALRKLRTSEQDFSSCWNPHCSMGSRDLAPYLNILLGSVLPRYFLVLFATVNSDFPPQLYLCVSQIRISPWILKKRPPDAYVGAHTRTPWPGYTFQVWKSLCWAHTGQGVLRDTGGCGSCWHYNHQFALHLYVKGRKHKPRNSKLCEVTLCFARTHSENWLLRYFSVVACLLILVFIYFQIGGGTVLSNLQTCWCMDL